ncbi:autotransporter assembly complex protein TamA [Altericroceibacterium spongiae]|uniref:autotransporter assembly complex protein TamA n=1 Tax=Altericroceibacterium spongiae TaxID=2320269 RepID=UPI001601668B|nr:BamA/TamA family outer membrane protein [Altericroceibacterium spongiae]
MRRLTAALVVSVSIFAVPLSAQAQSLEDLIPDSAVDNPDGWAQQGVPEDQQVEPGQEDQALPSEVEPDTPLNDMPLVTITWPDEDEVPPVEQLEPDQDIQFAELRRGRPRARPLHEVQISDELSLAFPLAEQESFPEQDQFVDRFKSLSTIVELDDDDSVARLIAQAQEDQELIQRLMRIYGYYNAEVFRTAAGGAEAGEQPSDADPSVRFDILPGTQYAFGTIDLGSLDQTGDDYPTLRDAFEIKPGDPVLQDKIVQEVSDLSTALGENGYAFAEVGEPDLLIDHEREEGDLTVPVDPKGKYVFGHVTSSLPDFLSGRHLEKIARFEMGETYKYSDQEDLRSAIQSTGLVSTIEISKVRKTEPQGDQPGTVDLNVEMNKAPLRTVAGSLGYGTGEGARVEASWEHRNLFPPEGMLRVRGVGGTQEQLLGVTFRRNNVNGRDRILTVDAYASNLNRQAYDAHTAALLATYERVSTLLFQKEFSWSAGVQLIATREREASSDEVKLPRQSYYIGAVPLYAQMDMSNDLLNPDRGFRLAARISPEISRTEGSNSFYIRNQVDASYYKRVSESVVLAGRVRLGSIPGASTSDIAPSRRLYAGGGGSVRGYGYQAIGPRNAAGEAAGGRSLTELSAEARIRTGLFDGALSVVPFVDAGAVDRTSTPKFSDIKVGAGIGIRYHTSFGPIRVDVGVPLNPEPSDAPVGVYVALGQAF